MRWAAFCMARNEEHYITDAVRCVLVQTIPPEIFFVRDDGSTDRTGEMLDGMEGVTVSHGSSHESGHHTRLYVEKRTDLMYAATLHPGVDYVLNVDADTRIPLDYVERITANMATDGVAVSGGMDTNGHGGILPVEPGMVIDATWMLQHSPRLQFDYEISMYSVLDGHPTIKYSDITLTHARPMKTNYTHADRMRAGGQMRAYNTYFPLALLRTARNRDAVALWGYLSYRGPPKDPALREWMKLYQKQRLRTKLGLKSWMFRADPNERGMFVLPKPAPAQ